VRTLTTERLTLRPWHLDDADFVFDMYARDEVQRYLGRNPTVLQHREQAVATIERWTALAHPIHHIWAIERTADGHLLGTLLLKPIPASQGLELNDTEIGWHLHPDAWGNGYATEAAGGLLEHAWRSGLDEVFAVTYPENVASQAVCRRLGMTHLGPTDRYYDITCELFRVTRPALTAR